MATKLTERYKKVKPAKMADMPMEPMRPSIHLSFKDLPAAKNWKIGSTYELELKVKQVSMHQDSMGGGASFEILSIKSE